MARTVDKLIFHVTAKCSRKIFPKKKIGEVNSIHLADLFLFQITDRKDCQGNLCGCELCFHHLPILSVAPSVLSLKSNVIHHNPASPTIVKIMRLMSEPCPPQINPTMSTPKSPIEPQFIAPIIANISAVVSMYTSSFLLFSYIVYPHKKPLIHTNKGFSTLIYFVFLEAFSSSSPLYFLRCQILSLYSSIVLSDEKKPLFATFKIAFFVQAFSSRYSVSILF